VGVATVWRSCLGPRKKIEIAWVLASLLDRNHRYTAEEIDTCVRQVVKPHVLDDPACQPSHIRLAMIENGFLERDPEGKSYSVRATFADAYGELGRQLSLRSPDSAQRKMACPECGRLLACSGMHEHYLKHHVNLQQVNEILTKYFT
jgi:hypothetical protein